MKNTLILIIVGIILFIIITNKYELFSDSTQQIQLTEFELSNIKKSIDSVADIFFTNAKNTLTENNIKILIDSFTKATNKEQFDKNIFVQNIFNDEKLELTENFKQSLYLELLEAHVMEKNLNNIAIRLIATEKITNNENIKKIKDNLLPNLKKISKIFILYLLKYYDNTVSNDKPKFDPDVVSLNQINQLINKNPKLFA
jgi:hypothetical protein